MIIAASLLGIAVLCYLILDYQNSRRVAEIRKEGVSLVRLLTLMTHEDLVSRQGDTNVLDALLYTRSHAEDSLLYAAVVDSEGQLVNQSSHAGVFAPTFPVLEHLHGERSLTLPDHSFGVIEFFGPLFDAGEPAGYVRVGYRLPGGISMSQLSFLGTLALVVFLLTTLAYVLFRREIRPLHELADEISTLVDRGSVQSVSIDASGELRTFLQRFNAFVKLAQTRIEHLEDQESQLVSSKKLINYRRNRVERVLESLPFGILVLDENGAITSVNSVTGRLLGVDPDAIRTSDADSWSPYPEFTAMLAEVRSRCRGSFSMEPIELPSVCADGRTLEVAARQVIDDGGAVVITRDITPEVLARNSRREFVAHIAHELKTPLHTLTLYSEALQGEDGADTGFRLEATNIISDEVERLASLINNMLSITRIETGSLSLSRSLVKPHDLLCDAFETARRGCREPGIEFDLDLPAELGPIHVDKDMLRVALNNLLTNAIKYNRVDGKVTLTAEEHDQTLVIEVRDTGIGIDESARERIFDKFYRADADEVRARPGHGLGLALAQDIVEVHNGVLQVESTPGEGSAFRIVLWKDAEAVRKAI